MSVFDEVSRVYDALPLHCKPRFGEEFTVLAAFLLRDSHGDLSVLSLASGTKCCNTNAYRDQEDSSKEREESLKGTIIEDSHAEVLARRGLVQYLMDCIEVLMDGGKESIANPLCIDTAGRIVWKTGYELILYISDNPCGDACIYTRKHKHVDDKETGMRFTGAKPINNTVPSSSLGTKEDGLSKTKKRKHAQLSEQEQQLGIPRLKSGRSDIDQKHRTNSMCCSDKLCRWVQLGIQGSLLSCICGTIPLNEVTVDQDLLAVSSEEQLRALGRAIVTRNTNNTNNIAPRLSIRSEGADSTHRYMQGKCMSEYIHLQAQVEREEAFVGEAEKKRKEIQTSKQKKKRRLGMRPSGCSFNWIRDIYIDNNDGKSDKHGKLGNIEDSTEYTLTNHSRTKHVAKGTCEFTQAQSGYLLGATKAQYGLPAGSRLCRRKQFMKFTSIVTKTNGKCLQEGLEHEWNNKVKQSEETETKEHNKKEGPGRLTYQWWKGLNAEYVSQRNSFLNSDTFKDQWLCADEERNLF
jgi:hypothetical protein